MAEDPNFREYRQVFRMIDRQGRGSLTPAEVWEVLGQLPSSRTLDKEAFEVMAGHEEMDERRFSEVMQAVREHCVVPAEKQIPQFHSAFLHEVFACIDSNRDKRLTAAELRSFFEVMTQKLQLPKPITAAEVDSYCQNADVPMGSRGFEFHDAEFVMEQFFDARKDVPISLVLNHARRVQEERQQRKSAVGGIFGRVKEAVAGRGGTGTPPRPRSPTSAGRDAAASGLLPRQSTARTVRDDASSDAGADARSPGVLEKFGFSLGGRRAAEQRAAAEAARRRGRQGSRSQGPQLLPEDEMHVRQLELEEQLAALRQQLRQRDDELAAARARPRSAGSRSPPAAAAPAAEPLLPDEVDEASLPPAQLAAALASLRERYAAVCDSMETAQEQLRIAAERAEKWEQEAAQQRQRVARAEAALAEERERVAHLERMRARQSEEDSSMRLQLREARAEAQRKAEELEDAQERLHAAQMDAQMEKIRAMPPESPFAESPRGYSIFRMTGTSFVDPLASAEDASEIVFLNPPRRVETAETAEATLFDEPGPLYYSVPSPLLPCQLCFDVLVSSRFVCEYISCRDSEKRRSAGLTIDRAHLRVSWGRSEAVELELGQWISVAVVFHWPYSSFSVHVGSQCICGEVPFRDKGASGVVAFDVYPRRTAAISYANIRFIT
eukprot:TRINITY_DN9004_c1_g4_i1.p1 TRINITY_DN9004_c1_g4~~TRINITY_DN9004_c1_g4_i1.p1  ORF type:complete len:700 (+),score=247.93 TRINITY_DN9004_c1_g4_i1:98-2101(+)